MARPKVFYFPSLIGLFERFILKIEGVRRSGVFREIRR